MRQRSTFLGKSGIIIAIILIAVLLLQLVIMVIIIIIMVIIVLQTVHLQKRQAGQGLGLPVASGVEMQHAYGDLCTGDVPYSPERLAQP